MENDQEMKTIDQEGNTWKISLSRTTKKTNRFQLSFFFNEKEFSLCKLQSNRSAQDMWELLQKFKKAQTSITTLPTEDNAPKPKERPKKRASK